MSSVKTYKCSNGCCSIKIMNYHRPNEYHLKIRRKKAGIFVYDPDKDSVLLVQSRGFLWGCPKGSINKEESEKECAIRETKEESGLDIDSSEFIKAVKVKNKALYYYVERKQKDVTVQKHVDDEKNDANGITWIKIKCLEEEVKKGRIGLNQHSRILFSKLKGLKFPKSNFIKVCKKKK